MNQSRWDDLLDRVTSRKFLLCVFMLALSGVGYAGGHMTWDQFQQAALIAVGIFSTAEGASDFAAALRPKRSPDAVVNVDASPVPASLTEPPAATTRRVRPSRAKKTVEVKG